MPWWTLLVWGGTARAQDGLGGYLQARAQFLGGVDGTPWMLTEQFRPAFDARLGEMLRFHATVEADVSQGRWEAEEARAVVDGFFQDVAHLFPDTCAVPETGPRYASIDDVLSVERLFVDLYTERVDLRVGRQALNWGSALVLNPTDLFAEVLVNEPWRERQGVNAVRANVPIGERHQVVAVAALEDSLDRGRFGLRPTFNVLETDLSAVFSATTEGDPFVGWDVRGQLEVGFWSEGGVAWDDDGEPHVEVSSGLDYSVTWFDGILFAVQYTYNGAGNPEPTTYDLTLKGGVDMPLPDCPEFASLLEPPTVPEEGSFILGRHYGLAWLRGQLTDTVLFTAASITNLQDRSTVLVPQLTWTPGAAWSLNVGGQVQLGEGEFRPGPDLTNVYLGTISGFGAQFLDISPLVPTWSAFAWVRYSL